MKGGSAAGWPCSGAKREAEELRHSGRAYRNTVSDRETLNVLSLYVTSVPHSPTFYTSEHL